MRATVDFDSVQVADVSRHFGRRRALANLSLTARAELQSDPAQAATIWKKTDNMWWSGPQDPNVCVLRVEPITAELWDGPASKAVAAFEFCVRLMVLFVLWLTLWARQLRKLDRQATK